MFSTRLTNQNIVILFSVFRIYFNRN